ncbi:MAG: haloacid dehalogenase-like hydrolase [Alphaproteobacteria bacterium]
MNRIVFCDFDGTIAEEETFVAVFHQFSPKLAAELVPLMQQRRMTLREGVSRILESIPSSRYPEILDFMRGRKIRAGFTELLDFLDAQRVPFVVISSGLRGMLETVLGPLYSRLHAVHALEVELDGPFLHPVSPAMSDEELVAKPAIMARYPAAFRVAIGDGVTDFRMAENADLVFARDRLAELLSERGVPFLAFEDFFTVRDHLAHIWHATVKGQSRA